MALGLDVDMALGLDVDLALGLDVDLALGLDVDRDLGLDALLETRRNKQKRPIEETVIACGSTYLILLVRLNSLLNRLGRFLAQSIASRLVSGL
jgi:hypothetical protein